MKNWQDTLVSPDSKILEAIEVINRSSLQVAMVVDSNRKLLGMVTDGDIRRAILKNIPMSTAVERIMMKDFVSASEKDEREKVLNLMEQNDLSRIPVIDGHGRVVDLKILLDIIKTEKLDNSVVIMAGGLGTRLRPLTRERPKPLLKVGNKPILETIIDNFREYGLDNFIISLNYKAEMIKEYFGDGSKWDINISYIDEEKPLGTVGALSLMPEKPASPFFVINGDLLTKINVKQLLEFHSRNNSFATMCVREYDFQVPYGVVKVDEHRLLGMEEKPIQSFFVNAGIYVLDPQSLDLIPPNSYLDMPNLFETMIGLSKNTTVFPIHEYWLDIGRTVDYERAHDDFQQHFK